MRESIVVFRPASVRVLNRGEFANALRPAIYTGRVASYQAKQHDEMQAVANALSLPANLVMAWNTSRRRDPPTSHIPAVVLARPAAERHRSTLVYLPRTPWLTPNGFNGTVLHPLCRLWTSVPTAGSSAGRLRRTSPCLLG